jgi:outer membrane biosynthesis protein TonB
MKLIGGKELSKHKLSELSAIASGHGFSLAGMSRPQIELAVGSLVFGDGSTAQQLRADLDEAAAPKQAPKAAKAVAAAAAAPKAVEEPKRGRGRPKKVVEPEPELEDEEPEEEEPEEEPAPAPVKKAAPAKKPAPPEPEPDVGPDHIPEEPDYSDLVDEDGEADEDADEDFEEEEAPAPKGKAFKVDAKNVPDFLKTAPKLTTIVTGLAKLYNVSDPDKIVEMLKAFAPYSPKIQQNLASITTLRIKGILSMSSGK